MDIPASGWNEETFAAHGERLMLTLDRQAKRTQRSLIRPFSVVIAQQIKRQVASVINRASTRVGFRAAKPPPLPVTVEIADESVWVAALNDVFASEGLELIASVQPAITSAAAAGRNEVGSLLGLVDVDRDSEILSRIVRSNVAEMVGNINETTKEKIRKLIEKNVRNGGTSRDLAEDIRGSVAIDSGRVNTIARTELSRAYSEGAISAYEQSPNVTHVSVIGCESREFEQWGKPWYRPFMYRGESTCNIRNVPVSEARLLRWHPNHTGTVVPSKFRRRERGRI